VKSELVAAEGTDNMRQTQGSNRGQNACSAKLSKLGRADNRLGQFVSLALALCVAATSAALAADLPAPAPIPPPVYAPPVYNWTGFYIGGNIGADWSGLSGNNFSDTLGSTFTAPTNVQFMGGGQVGVNYQFWSGVVIGAEVMFDWLASSANTQITATAPDGTAAFMDTINNRWLTTATGRLGYAWDRVLLYGKAGGAWLGGAVLGYRSAEPRLPSPAATTPISAGPPASALSGLSGTTGRCAPSTIISG